MSKIGIDLIMENVPVKPGSHKASWLYMWASQLRHAGNEVEVLHKKEWDDYDKIYIHQGSLIEDFSPNVFGGVSDKTVAKLKRLLDHDPSKFISLDIPMNDYGKFIKSRLHNKSTHPSAQDVDWDKVSEICANIPVIRQRDLSTDWLIIGDSHSFSMYKPGAMVNRTDGKTLNGVLSAGIKESIKEYGEKIKKLTLYFGNIDIRHHICRLNNGDYKKNIDHLIERYKEQLLELKETYEIELVSALPIENESRIIPNSIGRYKGLPFTGSWQERTDASKYFNVKLKELSVELGTDLWIHPSEYLNDLGELDYKVMEPKQNVHLSRQWYLWDLDNDVLRDFNKLPVKSTTSLF